MTFFSLACSCATLGSQVVLAGRRAVPALATRTALVAVRQMQEQLGLTAEQTNGIRQFLRSHRDKRRDFAAHFRSKEQAIRDALLSDTVDVEAIIVLRREIQDQQRASNDEAFRALATVLQSLSQEQRAAMLELAQGRSNSLLFL